MIVTSNRTIEEWIPLFDDPMLDQIARDRLAHNAYQIVMEGESYRKMQRLEVEKQESKTPKRRRSEPRDSILWYSDIQVSKRSASRLGE